MPQTFSARVVTSRNIELMSSDAAADTFWLRAQNLTRSDAPTKPPEMSGTSKTDFCGFCQACFHGVPETPNASIIEVDSKHSSDQQDIARYAASSKISCPNSVVRPCFEMDTGSQSIHAKSSMDDKAHGHS
jgi:hypothetical protein